LSRMMLSFAQGHCWDKMLTTLDERVRTLQSTYDSQSLAEAYGEHANIYRTLHSGKGFSIPRYFKVYFCIHGFSTSMAGQTFIFEGDADEDTEGFGRRMKRQHPSAMVLYPGVTAPPDVADIPHLRIGTVNVHKDQLHPINLRSGISPFFRLYQLTSHPSSFSSATRQEKPGVGVLAQMVQKTIYTTEEELPTLLGYSRIVREESTTLAPLQAAIDRTQRKTVDLAEILRSASPTEFREDEKLVRAIRGSVELDDGYSIATYHDLIVEAPLMNRDSMASSTEIDEESESQYDEQALLRKVLTVALEEHARVIEQALQDKFDSRLLVKRELRDKFESAFEPELQMIYPNGQWRIQSKAWIDPEPTTTTEEFPAVVQDNFDGGESDAETVTRRPSKRRNSLRKTLSFLSLSSRGRDSVAV